MTNIHDVEQLEEQLSGPTPGQAPFYNAITPSNWDYDK
jgi:hypothetical protein